MQFRLDRVKPIDILPDGSYIANVEWYEDDADPETDSPFLLDQVRLPYWHLQETEEEQERYLLAVLAERNRQLTEERRMRAAAKVPNRIQQLAGITHKVTGAGEVILRRQAVVEERITLGKVDAEDRDTVPDQKK